VKPSEVVYARQGKTVRVRRKKGKGEKWEEE
jgi:hypothetical protein